MTVLRNIWADLVEKRLWPLALVLAVALVAVPVVLARSGSATAPPPPAPAPAPTAGAATAAAKPVKVVAEAPRSAPHGHFHDPFVGPASRPSGQPAGASSPAPAPASGSAASSSAPQSGGSTPSSSASPAPSTTPASTPPSGSRPVVASRPVAPTGFQAGYRLDLSFGPAGTVKSSRDVIRLDPLRADKTPLAIFVGVKTDGRTAMFLLASDATATGDGHCFPTRAMCQLIFMRKGDSEFFDVPTGASGVVQYELDVDRVAKRYADTRAAARKARRRASKAGRAAMVAVVAAGHTYVSRFMYSTVRGVVFLPHHALTASASDAPKAPVPNP